MDNFIFKDAGINDLPTIVKIYNSTISSGMVTADTEQVMVESRIKWFEEHTPDKRPLYLIIDKNSETIGWVSFQDFYGRPAYQATAEISIYLDEKARGKGLGKKVLQHCINIAPDLGIKNLIGFIFLHNLPSIQLFTNSGFEIWGHLPNVAILNQMERSLMIFGKRVE